VSIALPRIGQDLLVPQDQLQWLVSAYSLTSGCMLLLFGRLADIWGRKKAFIIGSFSVAAFTLGCGFANSMHTLSQSISISINVNHRLSYPRHTACISGHWIGGYNTSGHWHSCTIVSSFPVTLYRICKFCSRSASWGWIGIGFGWSSDTGYSVCTFIRSSVQNFADWRT
jgi:MFS family permease